MAAKRTQRGVLAGGNWIVDRVKVIDRLPERDGLCSILREERGNGGAPYNVLIDLARLKAPFPLAGAGLVGRDVEGAEILRHCRESGVDVRYLKQTRAAPTSYTEVMTEVQTGRRTFFHRRGANALLGPEHFDFGKLRPKLFHLGYLLLLDRLDCLDRRGRTGASRILAAARQAGCRTSADLVSETGPLARKVVRASLPWIDYLIINESEAQAQTGVVTRRQGRLIPEGVSRAAQRLLGWGVGRAVFIHFPEGACACDPEGEAWQPAVRLPQGRIVGAVGAGDAFASGILFGMHEDWPMADALRLAVSAAACSLLSATASDGVVSWRRCLRVSEACGYRRLPAGAVAQP